MSTKVKNKKYEDGITLFIALILVSVLLLVGMSITTFAFKSLRLTDAATQSQYAFYAADSAAECALYWHRQEDAFCGEMKDSIHCFGFSAEEGPKKIDVSHDEGGGSCSFEDGETHIWTLSGGVYDDQFPVGDSGCASVTITKNAEDDFIIDASGRANCGDSGAINAERGVKIEERVTE